MDKVSFADRLSLSYLLEADRKEDFYQIISELICEEGLNQYLLNMLQTASKKWHEEVSND